MESPGRAGGCARDEQRGWEQPLGGTEAPEAAGRGTAGQVAWLAQLLQLCPECLPHPGIKQGLAVRRGAQDVALKRAQSKGHIRKRPGATSAHPRAPRTLWQCQLGAASALCLRGSCRHILEFKMLEILRTLSLEIKV